MSAVLHNTRHIFFYPLPTAFVQQCCPVLHSKDKMNVYLRIGIRHLALLCDSYGAAVVCFIVATNVWRLRRRVLSKVHGVSRWKVIFVSL